MKLNDIESFVLVTRHGGYISAGIALGVQRGTLYRRVYRLEKDLGIKLLERDRKSKGMALTRPGKEFYVVASEIYDKFVSLIETTKNKANTGFSRSTTASVTETNGLNTTGG